MRPLSNIALVILALVVALSIRFKPHEASRALLHDEEHKVTRMKNENLLFQSLAKDTPTHPPGSNPPTHGGSPGHPPHKSSKANTISQKKVAAGNTIQPMKVVNEEKNRNLMLESLANKTPTRPPGPNPPTHGPGRLPRKNSKANTISQKNVAAGNAMQPMKVVNEEKNRNLLSESLAQNTPTHPPRPNPPTYSPGRPPRKNSKANTISQKKVITGNAMQTIKAVNEKKYRNLSPESLEKNSINPPSTNGSKMASWSKASTIHQNTVSTHGGPPLV